MFFYKIIVLNLLLILYIHSMYINIYFNNITIKNILLKMLIIKNHKNRFYKLALKCIEVQIFGGD